jgi:hypothetical protein
VPLNLSRLLPVHWLDPSGSYFVWVGNDWNKLRTL